MANQNKRYSRSSKIGTLKILEKNDFNYLQTQKLTGVSRSTIKLWEKELGHDVFSGISPTEKTLKEVDAEMIKNDKKIIQQYYNLRRQLLNRIAILVPNETKLDPLLNTLKCITEEILKMEDSKKVPNESLNFIEMITARIIAKQENETAAPINQSKQFEKLAFYKNSPAESIPPGVI